ncbi:MAG TPA: hypothetical protein VHE55_06810 [Fimbriimonadaceae bacterium]|nr:hypothetical protein [Fimbriimonadaceae bacterium]
MANRIEAYMARLGRRIGRKLPQKEEFLREIRQHLEESRAALATDGMVGEAAEIEALRRMGSERLIAEGLVREHRGYGVRSPWRLGFLPALVLLVGFVLPTIFMLWMPIGLSIFEGLLWLPSIGTLLFVLACLRFRRILLLPLAAVLGASMIMGIASVALGPKGVTAYSAVLRKENIAGFDREIARLKAEYETARTATGATVLPASLARGHGYYYAAPVVSAAPELDRSIYNPIGTVTSHPQAYLLGMPKEEAVRRWKENGRFYSSQLLGQIQQQQTYRSAWLTSEGGWGTVGFASWRELIFNLKAFLFFGILNLLALGVLRLRDRLIQARWRPERVV